MKPTALMLAGLAVAYLVGGLPVPPAVPLGLATLSIAIPVALRELGVLKDHDELQRRAQRLGAVWAFLLLLAMAPIYVSLDQARDPFAGRSLEAAVALFALVYLVETQGAGHGVRTLLLIAGGLALAFGLSHLPDLDKLAAMTAVALGWAALAWLAGRWPGPSGALILALVVLRAVLAWNAELLPTTIFGLAAGFLLLRDRGPGDEGPER